MDFIRLNGTVEKILWILFLPFIYLKTPLICWLSNSTLFFIYKNQIKYPISTKFLSSQNSSVIYTYFLCLLMELKSYRQFILFSRSTLFFTVWFKTIYFKWTHYNKLKVVHMSPIYPNAVTKYNVFYHNISFNFSKGYKHI